MLSKLIKHEFRATGRIMGPLYLVLAALAVCANLAIRFLVHTDVWVLRLLGGLLMFAFGVAMTGVAIMAIVSMANRFRTNLMGDEGYVMFTLPASGHQLVWSKIIVSTAWFIATVLVELLGGLIASFELADLKRMFSEIAYYAGRFFQEYSLNAPVMIVEVIVLCLLGCVVICLQFYAAMATGHSFANHKSLLSVAFFFAFQFVLQFLSGIVINIMEQTGFFQMNFWDMGAMNVFQIVMGLSILACLIVGAIYYAITAVMLKKHLNLQ